MRAEVDESLDRANVDRNRPPNQPSRVGRLLFNSLDRPSKALNGRCKPAVIVGSKTLEREAFPRKHLWAHMPPLGKPVEDLVYLLKLSSDVRPAGCRRVGRCGNR